nr:hypothetical protein [uncultured bacterium]
MMRVEAELSFPFIFFHVLSFFCVRSALLEGYFFFLLILGLGHSLYSIDLFKSVRTKCATPSASKTLEGGSRRTPLIYNDLPFHVYVRI